MEYDVASRLAILGHPHRLALFRLLMRRYPDHVPAAELATALEVKASTLSAYIGRLMQVGLISQQREGTSLRYAIHMDEAQKMMDFLTQDCCRGRPDLCASGQIVAQTDHKKRKVLFVCTGNSARSLFAEAILRDLAPDRFEVFSAGTDPRENPNPFALNVLVQKGHATEELSCKSIDRFADETAPRFDFVISVCNQAANEERTVLPGHPLSAHWGISEPNVTSDGLKNNSFTESYGAILKRISAFEKLPLNDMTRVEQQGALDEIGTMETGEIT